MQTDIDQELQSLKDFATELTSDLDIMGGQIDRADPCQQLLERQLHQLADSSPEPSHMSRLGLDLGPTADSARDLGHLILN